jgi:hypothetical protein
MLYGSDARCAAQVVSFVHVADGCFHRAGKYKGANPNEAKSVADAVRRLVAGGCRSIGVVTFSVAHKAAIDDALAAARIADVFTPDEPLMVKSIEQVSGFDFRLVVLVTERWRMGKRLARHTGSR